MFPSPCGELRVADGSLQAKESYWVEEAQFPSPCGELRVADASGEEGLLLCSHVSVPLRGIEGS